jgi:hypothetical protein
MRINPFTARPNDDGPKGDSRTVKPAGKTLLRMPGVRPSYHCNEGSWDLAWLGEREMRGMEGKRKDGMGGPPRGRR